MIQEIQQEFEKKCEPVQATKRFLRFYLKATKLFETTRSHVTWYFEGSELASPVTVIQLYVQELAEADWMKMK